jgi:hypothetical protein
LKLVRAIVALLVGLAIAFSPVGAAWASIKVNATPSQHVVGAVATSDAAATAGMTDCEKMMRAAGQSTSKSDCLCCEDKNACPPDLCVFKCFKIFGTTALSKVAVQLAPLQFQPDKPDRPPDWISAPQPPPPRT